MDIRDSIAAPCPIIRFNALVGGQYRLRILWELSKGNRRYSQIQRAIEQATGGPIAPRVLSRALRELQAFGLIDRNGDAPARPTYSLTPAGGTFGPVMKAICEWDQART